MERLIIAFLHLILLSVAIYTRPQSNLLGYRGPKDAVSPIHNYLPSLLTQQAYLVFLLIRGTMWLFRLDLV